MIVPLLACSCNSSLLVKHFTFKSRNFDAKRCDGLSVTVLVTPWSS